MTPDETDLIRRYIAGELSPAAAEVAELLVLVDEDAASAVSLAIDLEAGGLSRAS